MKQSNIQCSTSTPAQPTITEETGVPGVRRSCALWGVLTLTSLVTCSNCPVSVPHNNQNQLHSQAPAYSASCLLHRDDGSIVALTSVSGMRHLGEHTGVCLSRLSPRESFPQA